DGVGLLGIQRAVRLVGHTIGPELDAAVVLERPLGPQNRVATSGQRLALGFGEIVQNANPLQRKSPRPEGGGFFERPDLLARFNVAASRSAQIPRMRLYKDVMAR